MSASGASEAKCANCGKGKEAGQAELQRCSACQRVWYCGKECQKAAWKGHKKTCGKEITVPNFIDMVVLANTAKDWEALLLWEYRLEELLDAANSDENRVDILMGFSLAHHTLGAYVKTAKYEERKVALLGSMQLLRDQGAAMCEAATALRMAGDLPGFRAWLKRARALGEANGFFETEANACHHLGMQDIREGRKEEGIEQLRHALSVTAFAEDEEKAKEQELIILEALLKALVEHSTNEPEDLDSLLARYGVAAKAVPFDDGGPSHYEIIAHHLRARLHDRRGLHAAVHNELQDMAQLAQENPRMAGYLFDMKLISTWHAAHFLLGQMRARGQI